MSSCLGAFGHASVTPGEIGVLLNNMRSMRLKESSRLLYESYFEPKNGNLIRRVAQVDWDGGDTADVSAFSVY